MRDERIGARHGRPMASLLVSDMSVAQTATAHLWRCGGRTGWGSRNVPEPEVATATMVKHRLPNGPHEPPAKRR
jgi:hypothetical protein